jgi:succinate dehydrogenase / fumarate reductase iron-sulfur subunit
MVQLTLPRNSRVKTGKTWNKPQSSRGWQEFRVYRWNPDDGQNPHLDTYWIERTACGPMVLDALIKIKNEIDASLTFRRSCREGICGSCSMNIDGTNTLACLKAIDDVKGPVKIYPLPHMRVVKDLVPDMTNFYAQLQSIEPWLKTSSADAAQGVEAGQGGPREARRPLRVHPVRVLLDVLSPATGGTTTATWAPPSYCRPTAGSSTAATRRPASGSDNLEDPFRLYRCHTILNCTKACPKGPQPRQGHRRAQEEDDRAQALRGTSGAGDPILEDACHARSRGLSGFRLRALEGLLPARAGPPWVMAW